jgi:hypothetical protein
MSARLRGLVGQLDPVVRLALARAAKGASALGTVTQVLAGAFLTVTPSTPDAATYTVSLAAGRSAVARVANVTALSALTRGDLAIVDSVGAVWTYEAAGTLTVDGIQVAAATGIGVGQWWRGPTLIGVQASAQTDWYWDPQAGSDEASGLVGQPVQHFAEIVRRYGTVAPRLPYGQSVTIHQLTPQTANTDSVTFEPFLSGGGQAILLCTLTVLQAPFTGGVVTAKVRGGPGTRLQVASMPAGVAAKQLVLNTTRSSYAFVDLMTGSTATMTQPLTAASLTTPNVPGPVEDDTWATGDTLEVFDCPLCNLTLWSPVAVDENVGATKASVGWVQFARIADSSGANASIFGMGSRCVANVLSSCRIDMRSDFTCANGRGQATYALGCDFTGLVQVLAGFASFQGGTLRGGVTTNVSAAIFGNDVYIHAAFQNGGLSELSHVFCDAAIIGTNGVGGILTALTSAALWGTAGVNLAAGGQFINASGTTWVLMLLTNGALQLSGLGTGSVYVGAGVMTDGVAITPANIDAGGGAGLPGIFNPRSGARYANS